MPELGVAESKARLKRIVDARIIELATWVSRGHGDKWEPENLKDESILEALGLGIALVRFSCTAYHKLLKRRKYQALADIIQESFVGLQLVGPDREKTLEIAVNEVRGRLWREKLGKKTVSDGTQQEKNQ